MFGQHLVSHLLLGNFLIAQITFTQLQSEAISLKLQTIELYSKTLATKLNRQLTGWTEIKKHFSYYHHLRTTSLHIRTNSLDGSEDEVCIFMREGSHTFGWHGLQLCIAFVKRISIYMVDTMMRCKSQRIYIRSCPDTQDKKWKIDKTLTSFNIYCNGKLVTVIPFRFYDCGEIVSRSNFGWIELIFKTNNYIFTAHIMSAALPGTFTNTTLQLLFRSPLPAGTAPSPNKESPNPSNFPAFLNSSFLKSPSIFLHYPIFAYIKK